MAIDGDDEESAQVSADVVTFCTGLTSIEVERSAVFKYPESVLAKLVQDNSKLETPESTIRMSTNIHETSLSPIIEYLKNDRAVLPYNTPKIAFLDDMSKLGIDVDPDAVESPYHSPAAITAFNCNLDAFDRLVLKGSLQDAIELAKLKMTAAKLAHSLAVKFAREGHLTCGWSPGDFQSIGISGDKTLNDCVQDGMNEYINEYLAVFGLRLKSSITWNTFTKFIVLELVE